MLRSSRQLLMAVAVGLPVLVLVSSGLYMVGMTHLEGEPRGFWPALQWAVETVTTTGYGGDSRWSHPIMILFVTGLQFVGVFLVFLVLPVVLLRLLEARFELKLPRQARDLKDHVVIYRYGPAVSTLLDEVEAAGLASLVIEEEEHECRRLLERGHRAILGGIEEEDLRSAGVVDARAIVANGEDDQNAALSLAVRQLGFRGEILALVEEPIHRKPMYLAGASAAYTPRHILAAALASRASKGVSSALGGLQRLGQQLEVQELRIQPDSPLVGKTLGQAAIGETTRATVVGQWVEGNLVAQPDSTMTLQAGGVLIAVGRAESLEQLAALAGGRVSRRREGKYVVAGYGEVGRKLVQLLTDAGEEVRVMDRTAGEGVDVVGNVLDQRVLEAANVESAKALLLALARDDTTLFATVCCKELDAEVPIFARVNQADNVRRIYQAGADYALSISQVSGQLLARRLLGQETVGLDAQLKLLKTSSSRLDGRRPRDLAMRERTGCSVLAVERGDDLIVELDPDFVFASGDAVYVCGSGEAVRKFSEAFP